MAAQSIGATTNSRFLALMLWLLCSTMLPILWLMQGLQGLFGSPARSINMAVALDACGNALLGGDPRMTISERTGLARIANKRWARIGAPVIDFFFGKDHCQAEALDWMAKHPGKKHKSFLLRPVQFTQ